MIQILWPTIRPDVFKNTYKYWLDNANNVDDIKITIAVNTEEQRNKLNEYDDVIIVGNERKGAAYATWMLSKDLRLNNDSDIVILASDDFFPPKNWDVWIKNKLKNQCKCLVVNDGYQYGDAVTLPIMTYGCLKKLNYIIYHPSYYHQYSDAELYDNVRELNLLIKYRDKNKDPLFDHKHWVNGKRNMDNNDANNNKKGGHDHKNYQIRSKLKISEKLKVIDFKFNIPAFNVNLNDIKIHRLNVFDDVKAERKSWHPFYDKTGNIENYFDKWFKNNLKSCNINEADFIYLPFKFVDYFKVFSPGLHYPDKNKIKFLIDKFKNDHFINNSDKYFTVCQWVKGTCINLIDCIKFMATATDKNHISIPLCTDEHPKIDTGIKYLASFVGNLENNGIRKKLFNVSKKHKNIKVINATTNLKSFRELINSSMFTLCPKGVGPASFRIFESFHVGSVPVIISDDYVKPYSEYVNWNDFSITIKEKDIDNIKEILESYRHRYQIMSKIGMDFYKKYCTRDKVCEGIIRKLIKIKK